MAPRRSSLRLPIRYYFAGFGLSLRLDPESHSPGIVYLDGRHHRLNIPELSNRNQPIDGFKVDIYMIGQFFKETLCISETSNQDFLEPLITQMTQQSPDARPDTDTLLYWWSDIRDRISPRHRRLPQEDPFIYGISDTWIAKALIALYMIFRWLVDNRT